MMILSYGGIWMSWLLWSGIAVLAFAVWVHLVNWAMHGKTESGLPSPGPLETGAHGEEARNGHA